MRDLPIASYRSRRPQQLPASNHFSDEIRVWQAGDTQLIPKSHKSSGKSVSALPITRRWLKVNYPVVGNWDLAKGFGIKALPVTLLIDRDGKVADFHDQRLIDRQALEMEIRTLLKVKSRRLIGN